MSSPIARVEIRFEEDVVHARQRARLIADLLGFGRQDQTRISTAVSEIARNAYQYAKGGEVEFVLDEQGATQLLGINVRDRGPGIVNLDVILEGRYVSRSGMGQGIVGSRALMNHFHIESQRGQGCTVFLGKTLPPGAPQVTPVALARIAEALARSQPETPLEEIRNQNRELIVALDQLRQRDEELGAINHELSETNIGMVALYTELEKNSEQLQRSEQRLLSRNNDLKGFAYTVAHDLKAPLRGIAGYADELERKHRAGLSERALFCLAQVLTATRNMDHLIEDLLHYSRLDVETPTFTPVHVRALVAAILQDRALVIAEQGVEVTLEIPAITLQTWERGLLQVLTNLIDNAIKYSRKASPPRLRISAEETGQGWRFSVSDNGIGFDMKYHDRIFGLFNRLVRSDEFEGTGAGLAIVKKVLDKLGGTVRAEAAVGQGATFFVALPK